MKINKSLSIIIPVYNGEKTIEQCLKKVTEETKGYTHEIIVIDDNSNDKTFSIVSKFKNIKLIKLDENNGVGYARNIGIQYSKYDILCYIDSDLIISKDSIHYLLNKIDKNKDVITLVLGGPTKDYNYSNDNILDIFSKINKRLKEYNLQLIINPSNRTPKRTIQLPKEYFAESCIVIDEVDKFAYLSSLALAKYIIVTCDSTSMISEAALTGKPIYVAMIPPFRNDKRFEKFRNLFEKLNIIKILENKLETWNYEKLNEADRIASIIKQKINQ